MCGRERVRKKEKETQNGDKERRAVEVRGMSHLRRCVGFFFGLCRMFWNLTFQSDGLFCLGKRVSVKLLKLRS